MYLDYRLNRLCAAYVLPEKAAISAEGQDSKANPHRAAFSRKAFPC
jgi:hypothetical protein